MTANTKPATYFQRAEPGRDLARPAGAITNAIRPATRNQDDVTSTSLPAIEPIRKVPGGRSARGAGVGPGGGWSGSGTWRGYPTPAPPRRRRSRCRRRSPRVTRHAVRDVARRSRSRTPVDGVEVLGCALAEPGRRLHDLPAALPVPHHRPAARAVSAPTPCAARVVHKVLEDLFDLPAAERTPEQAARPAGPRRGTAARGRARAGRDVRRGEGPEVAAWLASCRDGPGPLLHARGPARLEPAERELYVEALLDSKLLLRGFVDRLDVAPDGAIRVVDYKTGRAPGEGSRPRRCSR